MAQHYHWPSGALTDNGRKIAMCGDPVFGREAKAAELTDCPKCAKAIATAWLKAWNADDSHPRIEIERVKTHTEGSYAGYFKGHRYGYEVRFDGTPYGYLVMDGAYGAAEWALRELMDDYQPEEYLGREISDHDLELTGIPFDGRGGRRGRLFRTKETALQYIPQLIALGRLRTAPRIIADRKERREAEAKRQRESEARRAQLEADAAESRRVDKAERHDIILGLQELLRDKALSNFQRSAVAGALERIDRGGTLRKEIEEGLQA